MEEQFHMSRVRRHSAVDCKRGEVAGVDCQRGESASISSARQQARDANSRFKYFPNPIATTKLGFSSSSVNHGTSLSPLPSARLSSPTATPAASELAPVGPVHREPWSDGVSSRMLEGW